MYVTIFVYIYIFKFVREIYVFVPGLSKGKHIVDNGHTLIFVLPVVTLIIIIMFLCIFRCVCHTRKTLKL